MKAIVLAGGLGTRLADVTAGLPKPMAPVGSRPFLEHLLDYLIEQGVDAVVLAVSYRWEVIRDHFGDAYRGMSLAYSVEDEPLGTGGAIRQALDLAGLEEVAVFNGDTLFPVDLAALRAAHRAAGATLTMALKHVDDCGRFGRVEVSREGVITGFLEKGGSGAGWINGGVYWLDRRLFLDYSMSGRFSFEQDLVEPHIGSIRPAVFMSDAWFIDMGVPEDYHRLQRRIGGES